MQKLESLEQLLLYKFKDTNLLISAITHTSFLNETKDKPKYEFKKLEFLGDSVLEIIIRNHIVSKHYNISLPNMFKKKISIVNNKMLAEFGLAIGLDKYIKKSRGESKKKITEPTVIADVFEAICGAIYLDSHNIYNIEHFIFFHFSDKLSLLINS